MRDAGLAQIGIFVAKTCVFLRRGGNLAAEFKKTVKTDCQSPRAEFEIGRLRSPVLTGHHKQRDYLALAQMAKRAIKQVNGVLLQARRGAFWKSVRRKKQKVMFFIARSNFLREVVSQCPYFVGQRQINRGAKDRRSRVMSFTQGEKR